MNKLIKHMLTEIIKCEVKDQLDKYPQQPDGLGPDWIDVWQDIIGDTEVQIKRDLLAEGYKFSDA